MNYIYKYEDSMRQCETLFTENILKLCNYSMCLLSSSISSSESTERVKEYKILKKKLDTAKESIATLKSEYNDLTLHCTKSTSFGINFKETYFNYLARQETLRLKFLETISECKHINSRLDDILQYDCSNEALNECSNQNTSKRGRSNTADGFDLSSISKVYIVLPKLDWDYGDPLTLDSHNHESNSFSNEHAEELCIATAASASKSLEVSSSDLNNDVAVKKCNSTTVLETKKLKNLPSSKRNEAPNRRQSIVCNICSKNFSRKLYLKLHSLIHEGLKPFKCAECDKSFRTKHNMNRHTCHTPYHTRPYKCDICGRRYTVQCHLNAHKRHAGHYCSSKLSKTSADVVDGLNIKERDSTTVLNAKEVRKSVSSKQKKNSNSSKVFVCNVCDQNYSRWYHLKSHMISHEASKPFKCAECDKSFARKHSMRRHIVMMHINDQRSLTSQYYCAHCNHPSQSKETLVYHIERHHVSNLKSQ